MVRSCAPGAERMRTSAALMSTACAGDAAQCAERAAREAMTRSSLPVSAEVMRPVRREAVQEGGSRGVGRREGERWVGWVERRERRERK